MTLTEKIKDITEFYYETAEFMCNNHAFFKKQFGTFEKFNKVFADIILHEFEKIRDDVKNDTIQYCEPSWYDVKVLPPTHGCNIYNEDGTFKDEYLPTENVWSNENLIEYLRRK